MGNKLRAPEVSVMFGYWGDECAEAKRLAERERLEREANSLEAQLRRARFEAGQQVRLHTASKLPLPVPPLPLCSRAPPSLTSSPLYGRRFHSPTRQRLVVVAHEDEIMALKERLGMLNDEVVDRESGLRYVPDLRVENAELRAAKDEASERAELAERLRLEAEEDIKQERIEQEKLLQRLLSEQRRHLEGEIADLKNQILAHTDEYEKKAGGRAQLEMTISQLKREIAALERKSREEEATFQREREGLNASIQGLNASLEEEKEKAKVPSAALHSLSHGPIHGRSPIEAPPPWMRCLQSRAEPSPDFSTAVADQGQAEAEADAAAGEEEEDVAAGRSRPRRGARRAADLAAARSSAAQERGQGARPLPQLGRQRRRRGEPRRVPQGDAGARPQRAQKGHRRPLHGMGFGWRRRDRVQRNAEDFAFEADAGGR